jgi:hypothetical protein
MTPFKEACRVARVVVAALIVGAFACGDDSSADAGGDSGMDAAPDATGPEAGSICEPLCNRTQRCCDSDAGGVTCISVVEDDINCGGCDVVCAEGRGTSCELGACVCGPVVMGCLGTSQSWCCPPRNPGGTRYCADFDNDTQDCGGCGEQCTPERASDCQRGDCLCGNEGRGCAGTPDDLCCSGITEFSCVDTLTDFFNCGACGRACMTEQRCEMGTCV